MEEWRPWAERLYNWPSRPPAAGPAGAPESGSCLGYRIVIPHNGVAREYRDLGNTVFRSQQSGSDVGKWGTLNMAAAEMTRWLRRSTEPSRWRDPVRHGAQLWLRPARKKCWDGHLARAVRTSSCVSKVGITWDPVTHTTKLTALLDHQAHQRGELAAPRDRLSGPRAHALARSRRRRSPRRWAHSRSCALEGKALHVGSQLLGVRAARGRASMRRFAPTSWL